jgi:hypothetical protein
LISFTVITFFASLPISIVFRVIVFSGFPIILAIVHPSAPGWSLAAVQVPHEAGVE